MSKDVGFKTPRATMIKGELGRYELVDAHTHKHIKWLTDDAVEYYKRNPFIPTKDLKEN